MQFRRAVLKDKARILEICREIWEGHDYLPNIIDEWITDERGEFTVVIEDGQIMGVGKMTLVEPKVGWLEGLRVAPEARSRGFAKGMTNYYLKKGKALGLEQLRLSIYFANLPSMRVTETFGFQRIADFFHCQKKVAVTNRFSSRVHQLGPNDGLYREVLESLLNAPEQKGVQNFLGYGWLFKKMSRDLLAQEVENGHVYYLEEDGQMQAGVLIYPDFIKDECLYIPLITGTENGILELLEAVPYLADKKGFQVVAAMVPEDDRLKSLFFSQGFCHWEDIEHANIFVYQLDI